MTAADDVCGVRSPTVCRQRGEWLAPFRAVASPGFGRGQNDMEMERQTDRQREVSGWHRLEQWRRQDLDGDKTKFNN